MGNKIQGMRTFLLGWLVLLLPLSASATTWFVSGSGSDSASGLSATSAFRTLQHASNLSQPGDVIYAMNGTYTAATPAGNVLVITRSGTLANWITYKAYPGQKPAIESKGWSAVEFGPTVAYIELNGFTITGNNQNLDPQQAIQRGSQSKPIPDPLYDGNCISADGRKGTATQKPHHLRILNNIVSDCGGGGIALMQTDYVTISGNTIYNSAWYAIFGCSGISTFEDWNSDDATGYKMFITGNRVFGNRELVPWVEQGKITDGEGIIIDTLRSTSLGPYKGRTLVADNVVYDNGSAAIEVFRSDHVDVPNNSTYHDVEVPDVSGRGEMNLNDVTDIHVFNNIFYSAKGQNPLAIIVNKSCQCEIGSNLYFNGSNDPETLRGTGDLTADPLYRNLDLTRPLNVDLLLGAESPAIGSAKKPRGSSVDFSGQSRPQGRPWDRGAFRQ